MNPFADLPAVPTTTPNSKTFKEWSALGYRIRYGEKATGRNGDGVATFNDAQVDWHDDDDYDGDVGRAHDYHDPGPLNRF